MTRRMRLCVVWGLLAAGTACVDAPSELALASPDRLQFESEVYPVLLRDCAFHACHGSTERFLQVFGPGRGRLTPELMPLDPATTLEVQHSYERARSMLDPRAPEASLLLRKPLAAEAGGSGHLGTDDLGRNVYQSRLDPGYVALERWARGTAAALPALAP